MLSLDAILEQLESRKQAATYGAVGGLIGINHHILMNSRPRTHQNSWVVNKATHRPSGYAPDEIHPALESAIAERDVIETPEDLEEWLEQPPRRLGTMKGSVLYMAPDFDAPLEEFKEYSG